MSANSAFQCVVLPTDTDTASLARAAAAAPARALLLLSETAIGFDAAHYQGSVTNLRRLPVGKIEFQAAPRIQRNDDEARLFCFGSLRIR